MPYTLFLVASKSAGMINQQDVTKTSNCWGVANQKKGTNTNRIVVFQKNL